MRPLLREHLIDQLRRREFPENFGWKHARVTVPYLKQAEIFDETLFVFVCRNPFRFLHALFRRPYHAGLRNWTSKSDFLRSPWHLTGRDNLKCRSIDNPVRLWNVKTGSYVECSSVPNGVLVRYEDLIVDPEGFIDSLRGCGLTVKRPFRNVNRSTKGDAKSYEDYVREVRRFRATDWFSDRDFEFIASQLDRQLCRRLNYPLT